MFNKIEDKMIIDLILSFTLLLGLLFYSICFLIKVNVFWRNNATLIIHKNGIINKEAIFFKEIFWEDVNDVKFEKKLNQVFILYKFKKNTKLTKSKYNIPFLVNSILFAKRNRRVRIGFLSDSNQLKENLELAIIKYCKT